jgi:hypothetical protein
MKTKFLLLNHKHLYVGSDVLMDLSIKIIVV